eukprot:SAG25_NODE_559_length_6924_cov_15.045421_5_plen_171_part_00
MPAQAQPMLVPICHRLRVVDKAQRRTHARAHAVKEPIFSQRTRARARTHTRARPHTFTLSIASSEPSEPSMSSRCLAIPGGCASVGMERQNAWNSCWLIFCSDASAWAVRTVAPASRKPHSHADRSERDGRHRHHPHPDRAVATSYPHISAIRETACIEHAADMAVMSHR